MSSRSWVRCFVSTTFLCTSIKYQETHGKCGCVFTLGGNTYNISSLTSTFHAEDHLGWSYSFNPCASFKKGSPRKGACDCQSDAAICRWVFNQTYIKIGSKSTEECSYDKNTPKLRYSCGEWKAAVFLKCDPNEKEGIFRVRKAEFTNDFEFTLKHQCACANSCLFKPSTHTTKEPTATTDSSTLLSCI